MGRVPAAGLPDTVMGRIYSVRDVEQRVADSTMTGSQARAVADLYRPAFLFSPEIRAFPIVYTHLRLS